MSPEATNVPIDPTEAFDQQEPAVRQMKLSRSLIEVINRELVQHGIVIEISKVDYRAADPLTDDDPINRAIERARESGEVIPDAAARMIASLLHEGQSSAMYSLSSSGHIDLEQLQAEYGRDRLDPNLPPQVRDWIDELERYALDREDHGAIHGWSNLWLRDDEPAGENHCPACDAHLSEPHAPGCPLEVED